MEQAEYIATFCSHFGALQFHRLCRTLSYESELMPVPRALSSSCGTCVRFVGSFPPPVSPREYEDELEAVVLVRGEASYKPVYPDC